VLDIACPWHPAADQREQQIRIDLLRALIEGQAPAL
jgi:hypothetical protein